MSAHKPLSGSAFAPECAPKLPSPLAKLLKLDADVLNEKMWLTLIPVIVTLIIGGITAYAMTLQPKAGEAPSEAKASHSEAAH